MINKKINASWEDNNILRESRFYNRLFRDGELSELYEKLKNAIGASDLCDEIASSMDREELKKILDHLVEMYF